ncbi:MAG: AlpA family transcriptional regulator [Methylophilaceae bacterium]|nr:AlpA family transcriptional regulator [Methylophilaceae bacterium]
MQVNKIPKIGFLSLRQIIGDKKTNTPPIFPVGSTTWWNGIRTGIYPKGIKISARRTAWRIEDIETLLNSFK